MRVGYASRPTQRGTMRITRIAQGSGAAPGDVGELPHLDFVIERLTSLANSKDSEVILALLGMISRGARPASFDPSNQDSASDAGSRWNKEIGVELMNSQVKDAPKEIGSRLRINVLSILIATQCSENPATKTLVGYAGVEVARIKAVIDASKELKAAIPEYLAPPIIDPSNAIRELSAVKQFVLSAHKASSPYVAKHMRAGMTRGATRASSIPTTATLRYDVSRVTSEVMDSVIVRYVGIVGSGKYGETDAASISSFGENAVVVLFVSLNHDAFAGIDAAITEFARGEAALSSLKQLGMDWTKTMGMYLSDVKKVKPTATPPDAGSPDDPRATSNATEAKKRANAIFTRAAASAVEAKSRSGGAVAPLDAKTRGAVDADINEAARKFADANYGGAIPHDKWPSKDKVEEIGRIFGLIMAGIAMTPTSLLRHDDISDAEADLAAAWPGWYSALKRANGFPGGPLEKLLEASSGGGHLNVSNMRALYVLTYNKFKSLLDREISTVKSSGCPGKDGKALCDAYDKLASLVASNDMGLANPKDVELCFSGTSSPLSKKWTAGSVAMARDVVERGMRLGEEEGVNDKTMRTMADSILMHVLNWGRSIAESKDGVQEEMKWHDEDDYDNENRDVSGEFDRDHAESNLWGHVATIVFASQVLWIMQQNVRQMTARR